MNLSPWRNRAAALLIAAVAALAVLQPASAAQDPSPPKPVTASSIAAPFAVTVTIASTPRKGPDYGYDRIQPVVPAGTQVVSVCYIPTGNVFWDLVYARPGGGIVGFIPETNLSSGAQTSIC